MIKRRLLLLGVIFAFLLGFATGSFSDEFLSRFVHPQQIKKQILSIMQPQDVYIQFVGEAYGIIKENYWEEMDDKRVSALFFASAKRLAASNAASVQSLTKQDKEGVARMVSEIIKPMENEKKKEFTVALVDATLASLRPVERSRLYARVNKKALANLVNNIDPTTDHYKTLEVKKEAPQEEVKKAYEEKVQEIKQDELRTSPQETKKKIEETNRAFEALKTKEKRELYDKYKIEPTVSNRFIKPGILYLPIKRISPQTFQEFVNEVQSIKPEERGDALILDLRGNIGGSIDLLPHFLGPFIGKDQYAYEFYRRKEYIPFKTQTGWLLELAPYKNVVVLVNQNTQSSAEVIASVLKKYNVGVLVGETTRGWGTIERVFELKTQIDPKETYSLFLVHTVTLREDGQPIEGRGVEPVIDITQKDWDKELFTYVRRTDLIEAVKSLIQ